MKLANMRDSKSRAVRLAGSIPASGTYDLQTLAYVTGVALGDGNLSNPNGRAVRLRISCDVKYPGLIERIQTAIQKLFPKNKVSKVLLLKRNCIEVSCYSNKWEALLGWKASEGPKARQKVLIPQWIKNDRLFSIECLKGLLETDGSIYLDRGYKMINFVSIIPTLTKDVEEIIEKIGFLSHTQKYLEKTGSIKHTIRISKKVEEFLAIVSVKKS